MQHEFWLECWHQPTPAFHQTDIHPLLRAFRQRLLASHVQQDSTTLPSVLVPLCGKTLDMHFLAEQADVIGIELSEIACRDFFAEAKYLALIERDEPDTGHKLWRMFKPQSHHIRIWQGDFFTLAPLWVRQCEYIYDRAALIALAPSMRPSYVHQLRALVPHGCLLLITLEYPSHERQGPPFNVDTAEVHQLFSFAHIELVAIRDITGLGFAQRRFTTSQLIEKAYVIQW
jgi:thiopurine S-methyltransferase